MSQVEISASLSLAASDSSIKEALQPPYPRDIPLKHVSLAARGRLLVSRTGLPSVGLEECRKSNEAAAGGCPKQACEAITARRFIP